MDALNIIKDNFYFGWFALLLFFIGFCSSFLVEYFNIKFLKVFPSWFIKTITKFVNPGSGFIRIFLFIFLFNSISIAVYMSSGVFVVLPFIIAFLTGMNIGISVFIPQGKVDKSFKPPARVSAGKAFKVMLFSTLVLILEVLAFSLALGMGISLAISVASNYRYIYIVNLLLLKLEAYLIVCVPVLALSAYLEASVIKRD
ncbi:hypothetical protein ACFL4F_01600 [Candidatus Margulisiibacteriota bacterium]